ncbi:MAG: hydrogenase small subunit [Thermoguttaceae bacterium]
MGRYTRRQCLQWAAWLTAGLGVASDQVQAIALGLEKIANKQARLLWLQGMSCTGCSISLLNSDEPGPLQIVTELVSLVYHSNLSAAQGTVATDLVGRLIEEGGYILAVEGTVPAGMPEACSFGGEPFGNVLKRAAAKADLVVAVGTCACFGGIPAAEGNLTGAVPVRKFLADQGVLTKGRLINCPGCPTHPQSLVGTLAYAVAKGVPQLHPELLTPTMFYADSVHDNCPRFHSWQKQQFATKFGEKEGCLFKLGCLGPLSRANCPQTQWNGGVNWCIRAGAPCTACTSVDFAKWRNFPFYRKSEEVQPNLLADQQRKGTSS